MYFFPESSLFTSVSEINALWFAASLVQTFLNFIDMLYIEMLLRLS